MPATYGPQRFEHQPARVRRRGRKGMARMNRAQRSRRKASWARARGDAPLARSSGRGSRYWADGEEKLWSEMERRNRPASKRSSRKSSRRPGRSDYRAFFKERARTRGPVRFEKQPGWVRELGRKSRAGRRKSKSSSRRSLTRRQARRLRRSENRSMSRRSSRRSSRGRRSSGRGARVLTMNGLLQGLKKQRGMKAWVCVGKTRTGCGGGRKGRRGSRVFGILRA